MIAKALEIRRKVTKEIIKESLVRKGRFGITYATNVTDRLGEFVDHVMIEAAALKRLPEYEETRFNIRARTVIEECNFVPLVRSTSLLHISFGLFTSSAHKVFDVWSLRKKTLTFSMIELVLRVWLVRFVSFFLILFLPN